MAKTSSGIEENVAGLLCYVLGWITGLIFFLIENDNKFVRFHAVQSMVVFGAIAAAYIILAVIGAIPVINLINIVLYPLLGILTFVLWILLMVKAYQGKKYKLPWSGNLADKHA